ncbi:hypothetical protein ACER0C_023600 [Sarotherodon galilaeus]
MRMRHGYNAITIPAVPPLSLRSVVPGVGTVATCRRTLQQKGHRGDPRSIEFPADAAQGPSAVPLVLPVCAASSSPVKLPCPSGTALNTISIVISVVVSRYASSSWRASRVHPS